MGWEHYHTVDPLEKEPQVHRGPFGVRLLFLHFKLQFSNSIKSSKLISYFPQFNLSFEKKISFKKCPKITKNLQKNHKTLVNVLRGGIWCCLKHERDIGTKVTLQQNKLVLCSNQITCNRL